MFLFTRAFWRELRFTGLLALLLGCLIVQRSCSPAVVQAAPLAPLPAAPAHVRQPAGDTSTSAQPNLGRKALPRSRWHSVPGPAYLVYPLPQRPKQSFLDVDAARAAHLHKI